MSLWKRFTPPISESIRYFFCMGAGDILAQKFHEDKELEELNAVRTVKYATLGLIVVGPLMQFWRSLNFSSQGTCAISVCGCTAQQTTAALQKQVLRILQKILLHQLCFAPVLNLGMMTAVGIINGDKSEKIRAKIDKDFVPVMKQNYMIWPGTQLVNNLIMPAAFRMPLYQAAAVYWHMFLSDKLQGVHLSEKEKQQKQKDKEKKEKEKEKEAAKKRDSKQK